MVDLDPLDDPETLVIIIETNNTKKETTRYVKLRQTTKMVRVLEMIAKEHGAHASMLRMVYGGKVLQHDKTPKALKLKDGCVVYVTRGVGGPGINTYWATRDW